MFFVFVKKWYEKFAAGDFAMNDALCLSQPILCSLFVFLMVFTYILILCLISGMRRLLLPYAYEFHLHN